MYSFPADQLVLNRV